MTSSSSGFVRLAVTAGIAVSCSIALYWYLSQDEDKQQQQKQKQQSITSTDTATTTTTLEVPVVELKSFFNRDSLPDFYAEECKKVASALHHYGVVILRDPRVEEKHNDCFLDMMENYFGGSDGVRDARPAYGYQVGVTKDLVELPRNHCAVAGSMGPNNKPLSPCPPELDPKWRFFWRTGPRPAKTDFPSENMDAVIPPEFPEWKQVMDMWGGQMTDALFTVAEMAAVGFGMAPDTFTSRMLYGPHLLAPTGSDFQVYGTEGTVLAGFHYDLNFLTIHGKSRFPGLYIWTRDGTRTAVAIPDGCLLVQAGKQIEYLTGGHVLSGFHEVVVTRATRKVIEERASRGQSLWRVSSTCFGHIQSDQYLTPLPPFDSPQAIAKFPRIQAGLQVQQELKAIALIKE